MQLLITNTLDACEYKQTSGGKRYTIRVGSINNLKHKNMKMYNNNFSDLQKLENEKKVLVAKSNAECFYKTCIMADVHPKFELSGNKILFSI